VRRGDVYWYPFASPDKRRPVLVLTGSRSLPHLSTATVAGLSTTVRFVASQVPLGPDDGLPKACAVNLHQIFTVSQTALGPFIVSLTDGIMARVDLALGFALGLGERQGAVSLH
jgi:mRNA interferase MazF